MKLAPSAVPWECVYIFISSTFNDMHAERDYLVKRVFPELREWCERRRLRLVDIDLRWGVTEQDATQNKNAVRVCLERIDECRPFFLCFLGQRRGWAPQKDDVSEETLRVFPRLSQHIGYASITEMEILHAVLQPLHGDAATDSEGHSQKLVGAEHSFFYLRDDSYLSDLPTGPDVPGQLRATYTNEGVADPEERSQHDVELARWRTEVAALPGRGRRYSACWNPQASTPELRLPLACPSVDPHNIYRWRNQWRIAGVTVAEGDTSVGPDWLARAEDFNERLSRGRLADFNCEGRELKDTILADLRQAIAARHPGHVESSEEGELQKELDQQGQFLHLNSEGFIERAGAFDDLDAYLKDDSRQLFILAAPSGMGKSMLLSNGIDRWRNILAGAGGGLHFRFAGQSDHSTTIHGLLRSLLLELQAVGRIPVSIPEKVVGSDGRKTTRDIPLEVPVDPLRVREFWLEHLPRLGCAGRVCLVIDAIDQMERGLEDLDWLLLSGLPENVKIIVSLREDASGASLVLRQLEAAPEHVRLRRLRPFDGREERLSLVNAYLSRYLKELDAALVEEIISMPGAGTPLFLNVLLSELRVFGAFANLGAKIGTDFGDTPASAFNGMLKRLESDPAYSSIPPSSAAPLMFGLLAHARTGLSAEELSATLASALGQPDSQQVRSATSETVHLFLRQVRPFLARREGRADFFYQSFREAALARYTVAKPADPDQQVQSRTSRQWHRLLAGYFSALPLWSDEGRRKPNRRKVMELPYHQTMGEQWDELEGLLADIGFLEAKVAAGMAYELRTDFRVALDALTKDRRGYRLLKLLDGAIGRDIQFIAGHAVDYPQALFQCLWNTCWWYDNPEAGDYFDPPKSRRRKWKWPWKKEEHPLSSLLERWRKQKEEKTPGFLWIRSVHPPATALGADQKMVIQMGGHSRVLSFSPDGKSLASLAHSGIIRIWDVANGQEKKTLHQYKTNESVVALSPDIVLGSMSAP